MCTWDASFLSVKFFYFNVCVLNFDDANDWKFIKVTDLFEFLLCSFDILYPADWRWTQ